MNNGKNNAHRFELGQTVYSAHLLRISPELRFKMDTPGIIIARYETREVPSNRLIPYRGANAYEVLFEGQSTSYPVFEENLSANAGNAGVKRDEPMMLIPGKSADEMMEVNMKRRQSIPEEYSILDRLNSEPAKPVATAKPEDNKNLTTPETTPSETPNLIKIVNELPNEIQWLIKNSRLGQDELGDDLPDSGYFHKSIPLKMSHEILKWLQANGTEEKATAFDPWNTRDEVRYKFEDRYRRFEIALVAMRAANLKKNGKPLCTMNFRPKSPSEIQKLKAQEQAHNETKPEPMINQQVTVTLDIESIYTKWYSGYKSMSQRAIQGFLYTKPSGTKTLREIVEYAAQQEPEILITTEKGKKLPFETTEINISGYVMEYYLELRKQLGIAREKALKEQGNPNQEYGLISEQSSISIDSFAPDAFLGPIEKVHLDPQRKHSLILESGSRLHRLISPEKHLFYRLQKMTMGVAALKSESYAAFNRNSEAWEFHDSAEVKAIEQARYEAQYKNYLNQRDTELKNRNTSRYLSPKLLPEWLESEIEKNQFENMVDEHLEVIIYAHYQFKDNIFPDKGNHLWVCGLKETNGGKDIVLYWQSWDEAETQSIKEEQISIRKEVLYSYNSIHRDIDFQPKTLRECIYGPSTETEIEVNFDELFFGSWLPTEAEKTGDAQREILRDFDETLKASPVRSAIERYSLSPGIREIVGLGHNPIFNFSSKGDKVSHDSYISYFNFLVTHFNEKGRDEKSEQKAIPQNSNQQFPAFYSLIIRDLLAGIRNITVDENGLLRIEGQNKQCLQEKQFETLVGENHEWHSYFILLNAGSRERSILEKQSLANHKEFARVWEFHDEESLRAIRYGVSQFLFAKYLLEQKQDEEIFPDSLLKMMTAGEQYNQALPERDLRRFAFAKYKDKSMIFWAVKHEEPNHEQYEVLDCYCYMEETGEYFWVRMPIKTLYEQRPHPTERHKDFTPKRLCDILKEHKTQESKPSEAELDAIYETWLELEVRPSALNDTKADMRKTIPILNRQFSIRHLIEQAVQEKILRLLIPTTAEIPYPYTLSFQHKISSKSQTTALRYFYYLYEALELEIQDFGKKRFAFELGSTVYTILNPDLNGNLEGLVIAQVRKCLDTKGNYQDGYAIRNKELGILYVFGSELQKEPGKHGITSNILLSNLNGKARIQRAEEDLKHNSARLRIAKRMEEEGIITGPRIAGSNMSEREATRIAQGLLAAGQKRKEKPDSLEILNETGVLISHCQYIHFGTHTEEKWYFPTTNLSIDQITLLNDAKARLVQSPNSEIWLIETPENPEVTEALSKYASFIGQSEKAARPVPQPATSPKPNSSEIRTGESPKPEAKAIEKPPSIIINQLDINKVPQSLRSSFDEFGKLDESETETETANNFPIELSLLPEERVGQLTGAVDGQAFCHGYAIHNGRCIYVNMLGSRQATVAIQASLSKAKNINLIPHEDDIALELGPGGEKETGKYYEFTRVINEAHVASTILLHKDFTNPQYGGTGSTYIFKLSDEQALANLHHHLNELLSIAIFEEWIPFLWKMGLLNNYILRCRSNEALEVYALSLDRTNWTMLIQYALLHKNLRLPEAQD